jgi:transmembrane protein TMEM260 (protein O-mannosyltransferase)
VAVTSPGATLPRVIEAEPSPPTRRATRWVPVATGAVAFAAYAATAARTITWWDGSSYPLAAVTLGIPGAPGSLLLVLLGWLVSKLPLIHPVAFRLNLFAGLLAATLVGVVTWLGTRLATPEEREPGAAEQVAGALAGLTFAFGVTPWTYAVQFTPYVLSALWTALILAAALAWWRRPETSPGSARLFLLFLLFGLDLSVHRTNVLLLPAAVLWVAIRSPASGSRLREGATAAAGLLLGLSFHLLLIPLALRRPAYMVEDPSDLAGFWSYVTIEQKGGGFLMNLFPRRAPFLAVQLGDYLAFLRHNLSIMGCLPAALAALGWILTVPRHPRRALGMLAFFLCAGIGAVLYFNLPRAYMRPIDRHYLPSLVVLAPWMAVGAAALLRRVARAPGGVALAPALAMVLALAPAAAWRANRPVCDLSRWRFAESFARDLLEPLPERAILLTNGDNDSMPLWYLQQAEGVRPDVTVLNLPTANTGACVEQLRRRGPEFTNLLAGEPMRPVLPALSVKDSTVLTAVEPWADLGLPAGVEPPATVSFHVTGDLYGSDRVVLDLFRLTRWGRPVHLACTVVRDGLPWLWPYARLDGLAFRVIPSSDPAVWDVDHLRAQLFEHVRYRGIADSTVRMDVDSRAMCGNYAFALFQLASAQAARGQSREALATMEFLEARVPPGRLAAGAADAFHSFRAHIEEGIVRSGRKP